MGLQRAAAASLADGVLLRSDVGTWTTRPPWTNIAAELGCQIGSVRQALAAAGVPTRPRGRRRRLRTVREEELLELICRRGKAGQQVNSASTPRPSTGTSGDSASSSRPRQQAEHTVATRCNTASGATGNSADLRRQIFS